MLPVASMPDQGLPVMLDAAMVERYLPDAAAAISLAAFTLGVVGRTTDAGPTKVSLAPGALGTFAQAMPARLDAVDAPDGRPLLGMKWIAGNAGNRARGLPAMGSLVILNDPASGLPIAILDGSPITASRTAALSGAAIRILGRPDAPPRSALVLGAGVQGRAHLPVLAACGIEQVWVHDRHPERSAVLVNAGRVPGLEVEAVDDPGSCIGRADIVVSATSLGASAPWIGPIDVAPDVIVLPVDYGSQVTDALVISAETFVVDDRHAWLDNRARGRLPGWPEPIDTLGGLLLRRRETGWTRSPGIAVALHQGPGLADILFADAVLRSAIAAGEIAALTAADTAATTPSGAAPHV